MFGGIVKTFSYPRFRHCLPARDLCHHPSIFLHHWLAVPSGKVQPLPWQLELLTELPVNTEEKGGMWQLGCVICDAAGVSY